MNRHLNEKRCKTKKGKELGYNYEIWVYDKKDNKVVHY